GFNGFWSTDLWASFGYPGVIVGSAFVGAFMVLLDWLTLRWLWKTELVVALYAFLIVDSVRAGSVSIFTMLASGGLALAPLLAALIGSREIWLMLWPSYVPESSQDSTGSSVSPAPVEPRAG